MNFAEAFDTLTTLNETSTEYIIPSKYKFRAMHGKCPGDNCESKTFTSPAEYEKHVINCAKARAVFKVSKMPARIKVAKKGHNYDIMTNITEEGLQEYADKHKFCELCGRGGLEMHPDHIHAKDGSHTGTFRGMLCDNCNLMLGSFELGMAYGNFSSYEAYLNKLKWYLDRGEARAPAIEGYDKPDLNFKFGRSSK